MLRFVLNVLPLYSSMPSHKRLNYRLILDDAQKIQGAHQDPGEAEATDSSETNTSPPLSAASFESIDFNQIKKAKDLLHEIKERNNQRRQFVHDKEKDPLYPHSGYGIVFDYFKNIIENIVNGFIIIFQALWKYNWFVLATFCSLLVSIGLYHSFTTHFSGEDSSWWSSVEPGNKGLLYDKLRGRVVYEIEEGDTFKWPWQSVYQINVVPKTKIIKNLTAYSKELEMIQLNVRIIFSFPEDTIQDAFQIMGGKPIEEVWDDFIEPKTRDAVKNTFAQFSLTKIIPQQDAMKKKILEQIHASLNQFHIQILDIHFESMSLPSKSEKTQQTIEMKKMRLIEKALEKWDGRGEEFGETLKQIFK